jgi:hypothetical protein
MNNKVIATIDITTPSGRKILRDLQGKRAVKIEYPVPAGIENAPTHQEVFSKLVDELSEHYGVDMHKIVRL